MPKEFEACVKAGGKVRTRAIGKDKYMKICIPKGGGKGDSVGGEIHTKQKGRGKTRRN